MNAIKNGREEADNAPRRIAPTMVMEGHHMEQVKSVLVTRSISCAASVTEVRISPASVYRILTNSLGK